MNEHKSQKAMQCGDLHHGFALLAMTNGAFIKVLKGIGSFSGSFSVDFQ